MEVDCGRDIGKIRLSVLSFCGWCSVGLECRLCVRSGHLDRRFLYYPLGVSQKVERRTSVRTSEPWLRDMVSRVGVMERGRWGRGVV